MHDFVQLQVGYLFSENPNLALLYSQGHSIDEIAAQMGLAYSTTRKLLLKAGVTLRTNKSVSYSQMQRQNFKSSSPPPYGYCYLEGRLQKDSKEYPVLQIIKNQRQIGRTPTEIAKFLSGKGFKTRKGVSWKQAHVFNIIRRLKNLDGLT